MNQHDTTMMIAGQIIAALASQPNEDIFDPREASDYIEDPEGGFVRGENGYFYKPSGYSPVKEGTTHYRLVNTYEDRIARYAARLADKTVHAVQARLNGND